MSKPGWGGRRANQHGRPPRERKIRIGTLYLAPADRQRLIDRAQIGERLVTTAARLLLEQLGKTESPDPPETVSDAGSPPARS